MERMPVVAMAMAMQKCGTFIQMHQEVVNAT